MHGLRRDVLQVSQKCEDLDSTAECSMEAFQDVVCSVRLSRTQFGRTNCMSAYGTTVSPHSEGGRSAC